MTGDASIPFAPDGAWCWFQDPRAVYVHREHERTYGGWVTRTGALEVGGYDHRTGAAQRFVLKRGDGADDHNSPSLLVRDDGRLMAFYARHNRTGLHCRSTTRPEDIGTWGDEVEIANMPRSTYCHPVYLRDEGRYFAFWRGEEWKPVFSTSADGTLWSAPRMLVQEKGREADNVRPYLKLVADGTSTIHFAVTNGHPRDEPANSVYSFRYEQGEFRRPDGIPIGTIGGPPVSLADCACVYDGKAAGVRAWIWDIALDAQQRPSIAYTRLPAPTDHRYCCVRWDGSTWVDREITPGGGWFPQTPLFGREREPHYSGGMVFAHANPSVVYVSRPIGGVFEIEKWQADDDASTWAPTAITRHSVHNNVRPVTPRGYTGTADFVLWMRGRYVHYTNFRTEIRMAPDFAMPPQANSRARR